VRPHTSLCTAAAVLLAASGASASEFVLFDGTWTHTESTKGFSYPKTWKQPDSWTGATNYADGVAHSRYIVKSMASGKVISYQWCLFQGGSHHTCMGCTKLTGPGTYTTSSALKKMWTNFKVDWNKRFNKWMLVVKDDKGKPVDSRFGFGGKWNGSPDFNLYYPFEVHVTVVLVPAGATFTGWDNYVPGMPGIRGRIHEMTSDPRMKMLAERNMLGSVWQAAEKNASSDEEKGRDEARALCAFFEEYVATRKKAIVELKAKQPDRAAKELAELARTLSPSAASRGLSKEARAWSREPATRKAAQAALLFEQMMRSVKQLQRKLGGKKATDPAVARRCGVDIRTVQQYAYALKKRYGETESAARAAQLCSSLGINLPD